MIIDGDVWVLNEEGRGGGSINTSYIWQSDIETGRHIGR